ncbi:thiamine-phosphate kinase [Gryllotalpicola protaetiae]|uniref:Thiamine-monophosphate kinase n=1 Tax=Gryllotalpicola protaetiae TaxID=2419771 RepID=A0A387BDY6_9MICO|nr:thiamine-phosphate kinase [Gryllotalpicola protaetiae]AYG02165.1 thiamine-phosphate kinase [Gryllotalpicola protaetiae]
MAEAERPTLAEVGEIAVLARIFPRLPEADAALLGPGDDAAVLAAPDGRYVVTTDMLVHGPDFRWEFSTPEDLGWKAAATNLSDVAAMGARPTALVVGLAAPSSTPVDVLESFADGLRLACAELAPGCGVVGGDLSTSDVFTVAVTAFGDLEGRPPVRRSGARSGDVVAVAGELGVAARGLRLLFEHGRVEALRIDDHAVRRQLRPVPPIALGTAAAEAGASAMMDLSDGLVLDARRLAQASVVDLELDPLDDDQARGGEDHSLLATFSAGAELPDGFRSIGVVAPGTGRVRIGGREFVGLGGWDPYEQWDGRLS